MNESLIKKFYNREVEKEEEALHKFIDVVILVFAAVASALVFLPFNTNIILDGCIQKIFYLISLVTAGLLLLVALMIKFNYVLVHVQTQREIVRLHNESIGVNKDLFETNQVGPGRIVQSASEYLPLILMILIALEICSSLLFALAKLL
jgi:hypothetical protein